MGHIIGKRVRKTSTLFFKDKVLRGIVYSAMPL